MPLYFVQHQHTPETCPAKNPEMGRMLLQHISPQNARKFGLSILADAVLDGRHTFNLIVEAESEAAVQTFMQPFAQAGSVEIHPASHCEIVVERAGC